MQPNKFNLAFMPGKFEVRQSNNETIVDGIAVPYNSYSELLYGMFRERFLPGCFTKFLADDPDVFCCCHHDMNQLLGRTGNKTLTVRDTNEGLAISLPFPGTTYAQDMLKLIQRGDVKGMSVGFLSVVEEWDESDPNTVRRTIKEAIFREVSFTPYPAYIDTSVSLRDMYSKPEKPSKPGPVANCNNIPDQDRERLIKSLFLR